MAIERLPIKFDKARLALPFILLIMSVILLRQIGNPHLGYPDADRLLMDGVFILDFLKEMPLTRIYDYTINYYAQYPALSIGYRPPFFPFIEALFNGVFGINTWSSRLALLAFAIVGVTAWFKLVQRIFDTNTAFWTTLLLVTTPFVAKWGWYTMGELPLLSMAMITGYVFYVYTETERPLYLYAAAILLGLTVWTKQTALFLVFWFFLYSLMAGKLIIYFKRREVWIASAILAVIVIPLAVITLWLGKTNMAQSVGTADFEFKTASSRLSWDNLKILFITLYRYHLTLPVLIISLIGLGWAVVKRDRRSLYFILLIVSTYAFFSYIVNKNERYPIFWIPAFTVLAALPVYYLRHVRNARMAVMFILTGVVVYQIYLIYTRLPNYATGYDTAAAYILQNSRSPTVFFDGYNNGYFTYFMRALDPERSMYVLRADKLLSSSAIGYLGKHTQVHAASRQDIRKIFDQYGVHYVIVETKDWSNLDIHKELREFLKEEPFRLAKRIEVQSNREPLENQELLIYEYLDSTKNIMADYIEMRLPVVGQTIRVPMRKQPNVD